MKRRSLETTAVGKQSLSGTILTLRNSPILSGLLTCAVGGGLFIVFAPDTQQPPQPDERTQLGLSEPSLPQLETTEKRNTLRSQESFTTEREGQVVIGEEQSEKQVSAPGIQEKAAIGTVAASIGPNKLGIERNDLRAKPNPMGDGMFVWVIKTRFNGVQRLLIWVVLEGTAYPLNGSTKSITPGLPWPREANPTIWKRTGLNPFAAEEALRFVFDAGVLSEPAITTATVRLGEEQSDKTRTTAPLTCQGLIQIAEELAGIVEAMAAEAKRHGRSANFKRYYDRLDRLLKRIPTEPGWTSTRETKTALGRSADSLYNCTSTWATIAFGADKFTDEGIGVQIDMANEDLLKAVIALTAAGCR